jgi:hypothetical protein
MLAAAAAKMPVAAAAAVAVAGAGDGRLQETGSSDAGAQGADGLTATNSAAQGAKKKGDKVCLPTVFCIDIFLVLVCTRIFVLLG